MYPLDGQVSMSLQMGTCDDQFLGLLPPQQANFVRKIQRTSRLKTQLRRMQTGTEKRNMVCFWILQLGQAPQHDTHATMQVVHHGDPCRIDAYTADTRPFRVVARTMTEVYHMPPTSPRVVWVLCTRF